MGRVAVREAVLQCDEYIFIKARVSKKNHIYPHSTILKTDTARHAGEGAEGSKRPSYILFGGAGGAKVLLLKCNGIPF